MHSYEIAQIYQRQGDMDSPSVLESAVLARVVYSDEFYDKVLADIKQAVLREEEYSPSSLVSQIEALCYFL